MWSPPGGHFCTGYDLAKPIPQAPPKWSKMSPWVHCKSCAFIPEWIKLAPCVPKNKTRMVVVKILVHLLLIFQPPFHIVLNCIALGI